MKLKKYLTLPVLAMILLISSCASHSERKAPCSDNQRNSCGPLITEDSRYS